MTASIMVKFRLPTRNLQQMSPQVGFLDKIDDSFLTGLRCLLILERDLLEHQTENKMVGGYHLLNCHDFL